MRYYSSSAGAMTLTADITAGTSIIGVSSVTGLPTSFPYTIVLDVGQAAEEICTVTSSSGAALTVTRGQDGTSAQAHSLGAVVRHMMTARDLREPQEHIAGTTGVHGVAGAVVGTTDTQTLANKTVTAPLLTGATTIQSTGSLQINTGSPTTGATVLGVGLLGGTGSLKLTDRGELTCSTGSFGPYSNGSATVLKATMNTGNTVPVFSVQNSGGDSGGSNAQVAKFAWNSALDAVAVNVSGDPALGGSATFKALQVVKNGVETAAIDKDGNITSPTTASLSSRIGAVETNLGSQTTFAATSASKDGKRTHWGSVVAGPTDASGYANVTHGAGFTPTTVVASNSDGYQMGVDTFGATTFRIRILTAAGAVFSNASTTVSFFAGE